MNSTVRYRPASCSPERHVDIFVPALSLFKEAEFRLAAECLLDLIGRDVMLGSELVDDIFEPNDAVDIHSGAGDDPTHRLPRWKKRLPLTACR